MYNPVIDNILYEATYQGKSKNLMEAEKYLGIIIKKVQSYEYLSPEFYKFDPNKLNEIKKFEECIKKEFGFGRFEINFDPRPMINAYTSPARGIMTMFGTGMPHFPLKKGEKYYDKSHKYFCYVNFFTSFIPEFNMTPGECMAIILHEIGHNFDVSIPGIIAKKVLFMVDVLNSPILSILYDFAPFYLLVNDKFYTLLSHYYSDYASIYAKYMILLEDFSSIFSDLRSAAYVKQVVEYIIKGRPLKLFTDLVVGTGGEIFSDSFAVSYGYGKESASFMTKMTRYRYNKQRFTYSEELSHIPVLNTFLDINRMIIQTATSFVDPHPDMDTRLIFIQKRMEDLSKDNSLSPTQRKIIKKDLELIKSSRESYLKMKDERERGAYATILRKYLLDKTDGALDIKAFLIRALPYSEA